MRHWLLQIVRVWMWLFVPSLCVWLLIVRWNDGGVNRFEATWRWFEDHLAYPLAFQPITDPSWTALHEGNAFGATIGFVALVAVWAAIFAIPVALLGGWYVLLTRRTADASPGRATVDDFGVDVTSRTRPRGTAPGAPPLILIVTLPIALFYHGFLALRRIKLGRILRVFRPALIVFAFTVLLMLVIVWFAYFQTANTEAWDWGETYYNLQTYFWNGYLDALRVPRIFEEQFAGAFLSLDDRDRRGVRWFVDPHLQTIAVLIAVRTALIPTIPVAILCLIRFVYRRLGGTST